MTWNPSVNPSSHEAPPKLVVHVVSYVIGLVITLLLLWIVNYAAAAIYGFDVLQYLRSGEAGNQLKAISLFVMLVSVLLSLALSGAVRCLLMAISRPPVE